MLETLSLKVSKARKARLRAVAAARGTTVTRVIDAALDRVIAEAKPFEAPSCYDLIADVFEAPGGIGASGIGDLSTNKRRMAGFGRKKRGGS
ncbi:MAG TPA: hypothetical protein PLU30_04555 [Verrucomicrobiae bacterium]|nr:hypothetical protein [Verrucomicrobiae bacterium]